MGRALACILAVVGAACATPTPPTVPSVPRTPSAHVDEPLTGSEARGETTETSEADEASQPAPRVVIDGSICYILPQIYFTKGSSKVLADSREIIAVVSTSMMNDPKTLGFVEVEGFTDGAERGAVALSRARAQAVVDVMVASGVERWRLRASGYGAHCSEVTSDPDEQAKNRRVHFKVSRSEHGDTGAELGCDAATNAGLLPPAKPQSPFRPGEPPYARPARHVPP